MTSPTPDLPLVHTGERAGIPLLWSPADGQARVALAFRVGLHDEPYARGGITHLVEHLVFDGVGDPPYSVNAFVGLELTAFTARGTVEEVTAYLDHVVAALADLPVERLDLERAVLEAEAAANEPAVEEFLALIRWGLQAPGRRATTELALRTADAEAVKAWAAARFTAASAVLCWIGPEPPELHWRLPAGPVLELPSRLAPTIPTPYALAGDDEGVALSLTLPGGLPSAVLAELLQHRLLHELRQERALVYHVDADLKDLTPELTELVLKAGVNAHAAAQVQPVFLDELDRIGRGKIDPGELAVAVRRIREQVLHPEYLSTHLLDRALAITSGRPVPTLESQLASLDAIDVPSIAELADDARDTLVLLAPESVRPPAWCSTPESTPPREPFTGGETYRTGGLRSSRRVELTLADAGFTLALPGEVQISIAWDEIVAVTREPGGEYYLTAMDGNSAVIDPSSFKTDTAALAKAIEARLDPATFVPVPGAERMASVQAAAERDLKKPQKLRHALDALAQELEPGEEVRKLASALAGAMRWGVLAVTDRRTVFVMSFGDDADIDEYRHGRLHGVRVEDSMKGKVLILDVAPEPLKFWGFDRQDEARELRDVLEAALAE